MLLVGSSPNEHQFQPFPVLVRRIETAADDILDIASSTIRVGAGCPSFKLP